MSDSNEQVVTVEVDVPADDGAADPAAQEAGDTEGDTEQQQDETKQDSGSEDELETGGEKYFQNLPLPNGTENAPSIAVGQLTHPATVL